MKNQLFLAVPADAWERIFGKKEERVPCWYCGEKEPVCGFCGRGYEPCVMCKGRGFYIVDSHPVGNGLMMKYDCPNCQGTGRVKVKP